MRTSIDSAALLEVAVIFFGADERIKNGQDVPAIFYDAREYGKQLRFTFGISMPFGQDGRRHFDIATQLFRRVSTQKKTVKESGFALRERKIRDHFRRQRWSDCRHSKNAVYSKLCRRQVGRWFSCREPVKTARGRMQRNGA